MNSQQFVEQVQFLMNAQQFKQHQMVVNTNHYQWLRCKRCPITFLSTKDEFSIRQIANKVNQEQLTDAMRQLIAWIEEYPEVQARKIFEFCIALLNKLYTINIINETTFSRKNSFRNSFRRFGILPNKIEPAINQPQTPKSLKRNVQFNDKPVVYCITD